MAAGENSGRICYVLYPLDDLGEWIEEAAERFDVTIATVTGMDWSDDLTPWPAPGEPPGCPPFRGRAPEFLDTLTSKVLPEVERRLGISSHAERTLCGVSLSGLFTLWQWMLDDTFHNIISLSGSFWYAGFASWITSQPAPPQIRPGIFPARQPRGIYEGQGIPAGADGYGADCSLSEERRHRHHFRTGAGRPLPISRAATYALVHPYVFSVHASQLAAR